MLNWPQIKSEIKVELEKHPEGFGDSLGPRNIKIKIIKRFRKVKYPTGLKGYIGEIQAKAKGYETAIFSFDLTDGHPWEIQFLRYADDFSNPELN